MPATWIVMLVLDMELAGCVATRFYLVCWLITAQKTARMAYWAALVVHFVVLVRYRVVFGVNVTLSLLSECQ